MQNKIELLANYCNNLALQLSKKEFADNEAAFSHNVLAPLNAPLMNYPNQHFDLQAPQPSKVELSAMLPSELALEMVQLALKISGLLQTRFNLTQNLPMQSRIFQGVKEEDNQGNPYIMKNSEDRKTIEEKWQNQLFSSRDIIQNNESSLSWQAEKIKKDFQHQQKKLQQQLVREVMKKKGKRREISLEDFKMMAKKIFLDKAFRPTQSWCMSFLRRNGLEECVAFS